MRTAGSIEAFMTADHERLDALLEKAMRDDSIDSDAFEKFRAGLLRHIGMEEKILLPFAKKKRGGDPVAVASALRNDHGAIAKLLVPSPTRDLCARIREELARHNALEEGENGLYALCDDLAMNSNDAEDLLATLRAAPAVPLAPHYDGPPHRIRRSSVKPG